MYYSIHRLVSVRAIVTQQGYTATQEGYISKCESPFLFVWADAGYFHWQGSGPGKTRGPSKLALFGVDGPIAAVLFPSLWSRLFVNGGILFGPDAPMFGVAMGSPRSLSLKVPR